MRWLLVLGLAMASALGLLASGSEELERRFFDFTPISEANPVVATIDDRIEIPLSELRAYWEAERRHTIDLSNPQQRSVLLDDLIAEYLLVDEAWRTGVPQAPAFSRRMDATRTMLLTDFMAMHATKEKIAEPGGSQNTDAASALADRLFEAARIDISNEAYELVKRAARAIDTTRTASQRGPVVAPREEANARMRAIIEDTPDAVLARYENKTISVRQVLVIYAGLPPPRPAVATEAGLVELIKPLITPELMALAAVKQGIADDPEFRQKFIQNRTALLRFYMQDLITAELNRRMQSPDLETHLRAWYDKHKLLYAPLEGNRVAHTPPYEEARERVLGDYSVALMERIKTEKVTALRTARQIAIDDGALEKL